MPFDLELLDDYMGLMRGRPTGADCTLALMSCVLAQASAVQCRASRTWKARAMYRGDAAKRPRGAERATPEQSTPRCMQQVALHWQR